MTESESLAYCGYQTPAAAMARASTGGQTSQLATFRASHSSLSRVDREARIVRGVSIVELGDIRGDDRPLYADQRTCDQVLALAATFANGVKAHLTHPEGGEDPIASFLGRFYDFRPAAGGVVADLHVSKAAKDGDFVLSLAEEDPAAFGASLNVRLDLPAQMSAKRQDGKMPIRIRELMAVDIVGTPALTSGLLSESFSAKTAKAPPTSHLDAVQEYLASHGFFAANGVTLEHHVRDYFINTPGAPAPTDAVLSAVKVQSDALQERWRSGSVKGPWD